MKLYGSQSPGAKRDACTIKGRAGFFHIDLLFMSYDAYHELFTYFYGI